MTITFGFPEEWAAFTARNSEFFHYFPSLQIVFDKHLVRTVIDTNSADRVVLLLGRLCLEDFMEVLLLASNGYGVGALKLVRGLYERAVTINFLVANPDRVDDYVDYSRVEQFKAVNAWVEDHPEDLQAIEQLSKARTRLEEVKGRFPGRTWSGRDFVSLARTTGSLGQLLVEAYYQPLAHAHGTAQALIAHLELSKERGFEFISDPQIEEADNALRLAHKIMLYVIGSQVDHFRSGAMDDEVKICVHQFALIWRKPS